MRATLVGHACWLIETAQVRILTDPVLMDPFEEGTVTSCPSRAVDLSAIPDLDALYISHRHLDHYHFPSLAVLPRSLPVFCPDDPLLQASLRDIGFTDLRALGPYSRHELGDLSLLAVPGVSETFMEYGVVFHSADGLILNQVDTPLTGATIDRLRALLGRPIDVHIAMYACQDFTFFEGKRRDLAEVHATNLSAVARVGAGVVVPGAAGFRFVDELGWLNRHLFPISADRFMSDLRRLGTGQTPMSLNPGDQLEISADAVRVSRQGADFVRMTEADTHLIAHDPTAAVPALVDDNERGYPMDFLRRFVAGFVDQIMPVFISRAGPDDAVIKLYQQHRVPYRLEVCFPDGSTLVRIFRFDVSPPRVEADGSAEPLVHKKVAASALADVCGGRRGCFWMRTRARRSSAVFAMAPAQGGLLVEEVELRDLLTHLILLSKLAQKGEEGALMEFYGLIPEPGA
jgi:hypothetical protein